MHEMNDLSEVLQGNLDHNGMGRWDQMPNMLITNIYPSGLLMHSQIPSIWHTINPPTLPSQPVIFPPNFVIHQPH